MIHVLVAQVRNINNVVVNNQNTIKNKEIVEFEKIQNKVIFAQIAQNGTFVYDLST